jgi:hypothetical protein
MFNWLKRVWYRITGKKEPEATYLDKIENGILDSYLKYGEYPSFFSPEDMKKPISRDTFYYARDKQVQEELQHKKYYSQIQYDDARRNALLFNGHNKSNTNNNHSSYRNQNHDSSSHSGYGTR